jgi:hypothetical protein
MGLRDGITIALRAPARNDTHLRHEAINSPRHIITDISSLITTAIKDIF